MTPPPGTSPSAAAVDASSIDTVVIGSGVSGLTAAYLLATRTSQRVVLLEADSRAGGHAHTHDLRADDGSPMGVDSGFIVHNERTYPTLIRVFRELGVQTQPTDMSLSVSCEGCGLVWLGGQGAGPVFAQRRRLADPRFLAMLLQVPRFHRAARAVLRDGGDGLTWGEFLRRGRYGQYFIDHFAVPLVSCVWSASGEDALDYPARYLFSFLDNHGMLSVGGSPQWRSIVGGSRRYVDAIVERVGDVRLNAAVTSVRRHDDHVEVVTATGERLRARQAIIATHADQALRMLVDATPGEAADLAAIRYSRNETVLHHDESVLPSSRTAWACWNYRASTCGGDGDAVAVSYAMNLLQSLPSSTQHVVTLNPQHPIAPDKVVATMTYEHPIYTRESVAAATRLRDAGGPRLAFAGAHLGWGFHEDGALSGLRAAEKFGLTWS